ncbi:hypothetical protein CS053_08805 [Rhodanobacter glycinis]|uniref:Cyanophage baseplate Pam3 plug gp18 domain-containing protein n=1 Tax=Rhodanobacter glycinis TaxID=582702 RepID=A0A5B9DX31_9GAMM|nr:hypothetical protein [Rhodanobacter glycinis]QEE24592.1 hypothetical protein CS053_08805 [Rhodanobacter glycinis]
MTQRFYEVPLSARTQRCTVTLLNVSYQLTITWRDAASQWLLDVADATGNALLQGLLLIPGTNLLGQYAHQGIGAGLLVMLDNGTDDTVTFDNLGSTSHLRFVVNA